MAQRTQSGWEERGTREAVKNRSGQICEYCGRRRATEMHHRMSRGVGGVWSPGNIIHLCNTDHTEVTRHPAWAWGLGLIVKSHEDPETKKVYREDGTTFQPTSEVTR